MKSILLTSTALVAFAGAAAADGHQSGLTFGGEAKLGYNDDIKNGFYWEASLDATMSADLDNGVTASASFGLNIVEDDLGEAVSTSDYVLKLATDNSSLSFGDVDPVAEDRWDGVDGSDVAGFNDKDTHLDVAGFEALIVGETTVAGFTAAMSAGVDAEGGNDLTGEVIDAYQLYVSGAVSMFDMEFAFQNEFGPTPQIVGVGAGFTFAGANLKVAYEMASDIDDTVADEENSSIGVEGSYGFGPATATAYYSINDEAEDNYGASVDYVSGPIAVSAEVDVDGGENGAEDVTSYGIEGSYDVGNGISVLAGYLDPNTDGDDDAQYYVAGTYDLGGGAEILVSYAEDEGNDGNDEIGDPEYFDGTTVEVSFEF